MVNHWSLLQFALIAGFVLAATLTLLTAACERPLRRLLSDKTPPQRVRILWWVLVTPALAGTTYAVMTIAMPSVLHDSAGFAAVCSTHFDTLWHWCIWHSSENGQSIWLWIALVLLAGYATWSVVRAVADYWRIRQTYAAMIRLSRFSEYPNRLHVLDTDRPVALACGIGRGCILLSSSLLEQLDSRQLRIVLAHEQAHIAHRDVLYRLIAVVLSSIQLPGTRHRLLNDLELALEQRCDLAAAKSVGCPIAVAETIIAVEKIFQGSTKKDIPLSMAFFSDFVLERVEALLSPECKSVSYLGLFLGLGVLTFCSLSVGWLHSLTESFIAMLAS